MHLITHILATDPTFWLPKGASNLARDVDWAWNIILYVTGIFFCIVVGAMTFFVIRYRRRPGAGATSTVTHNTPLEIAWTVIPLILVIMFFFVGFKGFLNYDNPPSDCVAIDVQAQKWFFTFKYPNGAQDGNLYVLKGQDVRLNLHSVDVLHALYIPVFRTQRNFIPWRYTTIWFNPEETSPMGGKEGWPIFCTQYCGDGHSRMFARVFVLDKKDYEEKMTELANPFKRKDPGTGKSTYVPYTELGKALYSQKGCSTCHSVDEKESIGTGPPWHGLWKRDHQFAYSNDPNFTLKASDSDEKWEAYLKESMIHPEAKLVSYKGKDFGNQMPTFAGQLDGNVTNDEEARAIMSFMKSIGNQGWKPDVTPKDNPDLFDADHPVLFDSDHNPVHPESLAGIEARKKLSAQPAGASSLPGSR